MAYSTSPTCRGGGVNHPSELVSIGDRIKVKVLSYDRKRERISLGLKQLTPHPWENIENKYPIESQVRGKVVSITDYGAFVELEEGIEGLVHISEMSWTQHVRHPSKLVTIGDIVEVKVLKIDSESQKISLGMKQTEDDPWDTLDAKYPPGTKIEGTVCSLTNFGAFVALEDNIDGLVHISDMSWTKRIRQASEMFKKGDVIPWSSPKSTSSAAVSRSATRMPLKTPGLASPSSTPWASRSKARSRGSSSAASWSRSSTKSMGSCRCRSWPSTGCKPRARALPKGRSFR